MNADTRKWKEQIRVYLRASAARSPYPGYFAHPQAQQATAAHRQM